MVMLKRVWDRVTGGVSFACESVFIAVYLRVCKCICLNDKCRWYYRWPIKAAACNETTETEIMVMVNWGESGK